jgi:hypothetical protein
MTADPETIAISALSFLASDPERFEFFIRMTGLEAGNLREAAASPGFLAAVLDHIMSNDTLLTDFAADSNVAPETIPAARLALGHD